MIRIMEVLKEQPSLRNKSIFQALITDYSLPLFLTVCRPAAHVIMRGKSGQRRVPYFLTGSCSQEQSNVTENDRPACRVRVKR